MPDMTRASLGPHTTIPISKHMLSLHCPTVRLSSLPAIDAAPCSLLSALCPPTDWAGQGVGCREELVVLEICSTAPCTHGCTCALQQGKGGAGQATVKGWGQGIMWRAGQACRVGQGRPGHLIHLSTGACCVVAGRTNGELRAPD